MTTNGTRTAPSRGLVLGCGGTLGTAWMIGALHSLQQAVSWDLRSADVLVGTSAGAEVAAMLGAGIGVSELLAAQIAAEDARPELARHFAHPPRRTPPRPALLLGSPRLARRALGGGVPALTGLSGLLPRGRGDAAWLAALADHLAPDGAWVPHPATWLVATDLETGRRRLLGHPEAPEAALRDALRASWAIPGWFPPVRIDGRLYADGGISSPTSADLLVPRGLDEVYVVAPMSSVAPGRRSGPGRAEAALRRVMTRTLNAECAVLRGAGTRVIRIEPTAADLNTMGGNLMDPRRRLAVLETSLRTTRTVVRDALPTAVPRPRLPAPRQEPDRPRPEAPKAARTSETHDVEVLVIGSGMSGIGAAVTLRRSGVRDLVLLEKADTLGGTWRDNTYPGCACDVPSALYSYSFAPNPEWTRAFAGQAEIRSYLQNTAAAYGITPLIRFGTEVTRAQWHPHEARWHVETTRDRYTARFLIAAAGPWHEPLTPDIPGLADFPGEVFHSSRWRHDHELEGARVAVVGSGASAVQFVPAIQPLVSRLHLFQRTAQWVLPKPDHHVPRVERLLMRRFPAAQRALRTAEYAALETLGVGFRHPALLRAVQKVGDLHLRATVKDPQLRRALTPDYTLGCKRLLLSNTYYPALTRPNVSVHATAVESVQGNRVVGADGSTAEVDTIILGTGFHILDMPVARRVFDGDGASLDDHWKGSPDAYLGTTVSGFPNAFILLGPHLGTGHSSAFMVLEAQLQYVAAAVRHSRSADWASMDVRPEVQAAFRAEVQQALPSTVYNAGGCLSYYLDDNGLNSFSWPWSTGRMRRRLAQFEAGAYDVTTKAPIAPRVAGSAGIL
ncbi:patatin-like phospholipase family protein [Streptomyces sp. NEAU-NA10]|uniref:patatin-like phospholipase family protein n=1 Tax=Streptomyces sp. NEAU-NA10 TaxID=3416050 RepID=UPI003CC56F79